MKDMTIGFDAKRIVRNGTGLGSYGRTLVNSLAAENQNVQWRLYAPDAGRDDLRSQVISTPRLSFVYPSRAFFKFQKALWRSHGIVKDLKRDRVNIYHGLTGELPKGLRQAGIRSVVTIHDLIFMRHPEYYHWLDAKIYVHKFHAALKEVDRIIAISECTKRDILSFGHFPENRIDVIYQSCSMRFRQRADDTANEAVRRLYALPQRYILNVGTIEERKNILLAVKALLQLPNDVSLVIVGRPTSYADKVKLFVQAHQLCTRVKFLHRIPDAHLPSIYQQAECFVYPSRYEGFGIPVIEALQSGLPVVACTGSCLEEAGGPDCLYVHPDDVEGMASALRQRLRGAEGREKSIVMSREYIRRFETANVAKQVMQVYRRL